MTFQKHTRPTDRRSGGEFLLLALSSAPELVEGCRRTSKGKKQKLPARTYRLVRAGDKT